MDIRITETEMQINKEDPDCPEQDPCRKENDTTNID